MNNTPVSFVERATDYNFFRIEPDRYNRNSILSITILVTKPILRAIAASFVIPVAASASAVWHGGKIIRRLPLLLSRFSEGRQPYDADARVLMQDLRYARAIIIASSKTIFGFAIATPVGAIGAIAEITTGRDFNPRLKSFVVNCVTLKLMDMELESIQESRRVRNAFNLGPHVDVADLNTFTQTLLRELLQRYGMSDEVGTWSINTTRDDLANNPDKIIDDIAKDLYDRSPKIHQITVRFGREEAFDAGGPSREFVSQLFSSLATHALTKKSESYTFIKDSGACLPTSHASSKETKYRFAQQDEIDTFSDAELRECLQLAFGAVIPDAYQLGGKISAQKVRDQYEVIRTNISPLTKKEQAGYEVIGAFLSHSQRRLNYPIGQIFSHCLFDVLRNFTYEELTVPFTALAQTTLINLYKIRQKESVVFQKAYQLLQMRPNELKAAGEWKQDLFYYVYPDGDFPDFLVTDGTPDLAKLEQNFSLFLASAKERLYREALADRTLPAIHAIGMGMAKGYNSRERWRQINRLTAEELSRQIQGELRKDVIIRKIVSADERIKGYMRQWIQNATQKQLVDLVKAATGSPTIGPNQVLLLQAHNNVATMCVFHTCTGQIDIPRYASYAIFKAKLEESVAHALASGFTLA